MVSVYWGALRLNVRECGFTFRKRGAHVGRVGAVFQFADAPGVAVAVGGKAVDVGGRVVLVGGGGPASCRNRRC